MANATRRAAAELRGIAAAAGILLLAAAAAAHSLSPGDVVARLSLPAVRSTFDVSDVAPDPKLPRLLLIRVGPKWQTVPAAQRIAAAEEWQHMWRDSIRNGIVAIVDASNDRPLVNFDARGTATLHDPPPGEKGGRPTP